MKTTNCKRCRAEIDPLAVFPGVICLACYEKDFNAAVARNGGVLPRPDFGKAITFQLRYAYKGGKLGKPIQLGTRTAWPEADAKRIAATLSYPKAVRIVPQPAESEGAS